MKRTSQAQVVLGVCGFTHDSSAALIVGDTLAGFVEEERLSGEKHTRAFPTHAVGWLLDAYGLQPQDVTSVAYNFDWRRFLAALAPPESLACASDRALPRARSFLKVGALTRRRLKLLKSRFPLAQVRGVRHHLAHGLYAHLASGLARSAVLVVDSLGERETTSIARACGVKLSPLLALRDPHSLGYAFGAVTEHLGFRRGDEEGTVMALAALGDPTRFRPLMKEGICLTPSGFNLNPRWFPVRVLDHRFPRVSAAFVGHTCPRRSHGEPLEQVHADLAASLQERTEEAMVHLARLAARLTGERQLALGGGVAMNCVAVGRLLADCAFEEVFVPSAPGDSGTAIGAAAAVAVASTGSAPEGLDLCHQGPSYTSGRVRAAVAHAGLRSRWVGQPADFLAERLARGQIVGLFQGRVEAGPRALGNRSILASPLASGVVDRLNAEIKFREPFRPYAPVVLAERASEWFHLRQEAPHMSVAVPVTPAAQRRLAAVTHGNGLARVQTVTVAQNPLLAAILERFADRTGIPVLINTSLNVKGQPICGTPEMALDCLQRGGLDGLLIEGEWVTR